MVLAHLPSQPIDSPILDQMASLSCVTWVGGWVISSIPYWCVSCLYTIYVHLLVKKYTQYTDICLRVSLYTHVCLCAKR